MATASQRHPGGRPRKLRRCPIGEKIERLAAARVMHLDEVAEKAGISLVALHLICTGRTKSPKLDTVKAIAAALGVKIDKLAS